MYTNAHVSPTHSLRNHDVEAIRILPLRKPPILTRNQHDLAPIQRDFTPF